MSDGSKIEWTEASWNPLRATFVEDYQGLAGWHCVHASEGCRNCYAEKINLRLGTRLNYTAPNTSKITPILETNVLLQPLHWRKPRRIFVCSMTDLFGEWHTDEMIDRVFAVMALCPWHTFQVLTKRAERMHSYFTSLNDGATAAQRGFDACLWADTVTGFTLGVGRSLERIPSGLPNVWLGVSVEDQKNANERIPWLLKTPAIVRWVSYEPALASVDFRNINHDNLVGIDSLTGDHGVLRPFAGRSDRKLNWVVVGGESGPGARPFDAQWARDTIAQCKAASVSCFVKQLGTKPFDTFLDKPFHLIKTDRKGGDWSEWPQDLRVREYPQTAAVAAGGRV